MSPLWESSNFSSTGKAQLWTAEITLRDLALALGILPTCQEVLTVTGVAQNFFDFPHC